MADPRRRGERAKRTDQVDVGVPSTGCRFSPRCPHATDLCHQTRPPVRRVDGADVLCHYAGEM